MNKQLKTGMIISYNGAETSGVVVAITDGGGYAVLYNPSNKKTSTCFNPALVKILNQNYVGSFMTPDQIFNDWLEQSVPLLQNIQALKQKVAAVKPKALEQKLFRFESQYACPVIQILVKEWKKDHATIYFNEKEITLHDISQLRLATKLEIAGMRINPHTLKIGESIGYTETIVDALEYFDNINNKSVTC